MELEETYSVIKFFKEDGKPSEIVDTGLSLREAQFVCNDPETKSEDWFYGYRQE